ncbi:hypothetical protein NIES2119_24625 [[Phormidium ambiguum] IAM M-71]|uniref:SH3b domain-containing protein n=1 Tax=[Phormidium ambiguum] IAM M-71 TaxID=454136 RepID=A0A1U7I930_9CYAN|nr:SH3 domain-containing protein [Phormidium ambiguum]OKH32928.1 hypothetical protein NIES2119_24625 [Phormidium ambiguum IAM M-71]
MKNVKLNAVQSLAAISILFSPTLSLVAANTQEIPQKLADAAKEACIRSAEAKGFKIEQVVSLEPNGTDGVRAILSQSRNGQANQLTCGYSEKDGAVFNEETTETTITIVPTTAVITEFGTALVPTATDFAPLWWLLLPLLALPLLLWWTKRRDALETSEANAYVTTAVADKDYEAIVRTNGSLINVHLGPNDTHTIIGTLRDNQRVSLSGRYDNNWAELINGGWVNSQYLEYLETNPRYQTS